MNVVKLLSLKRWRQEIKTPTRRWSNFILDYVHGSHFRDIVSGKSDPPSRAAYLWSTQSQAVTFDFVWKLFYAYYQLTRIGYDQFDVMLYCPPDLTPANLQYDHFVPICDRQARIQNLIFPIASLFSHVRSVSIISSKLEYDVFCSRPSDDFLIYPFGHSKNYDPGGALYFDIYRALRSYEDQPSRLPFIAPRAPLKDEDSHFSKAHSDLIERFPDFFQKSTNVYYFDAQGLWIFTLFVIQVSMM